MHKTKASFKEQQLCWGYSPTASDWWCHTTQFPLATEAEWAYHPPNKNIGVRTWNPWSCYVGTCVCSRAGRCVRRRAACRAAAGRPAAAARAAAPRAARAAPAGPPHTPCPPPAPAPPRSTSAGATPRTLRNERLWALVAVRGVVTDYG